ncbi:BTB POZ domain-containing [Cryptosporidium sp. chipmunk genotype I]|uniref:BTB POZ domain-containing n=1 Tax=Cryptosporidium sp. chipmunk genotype I TaxID=1280935 RepID=UPI00351A3623|nr:BTB POZ domain-containing [Cryptosporidium sp. chipmunk genotype I]
MSVVNCSSTRLRTDSIEYIWTIEDFPLIRILAIQRALPNHDRIISKKFGDQHNGTWFLTLFPAGVNCDGNMLSIYLFSYSEQIRIAQFEISLLDDRLNIIEGTTVSLSQPRVFSVNDSSWGWEDYMQINIVDDTILIDGNSNKSSLSREIPPPFENNLERTRSLDELIYFSDEALDTYSTQNNSLGSSYEIKSSEDKILNWERTILKYFVFGGAIRVKINIKSYKEVIHSDGSVIVPSFLSNRIVTQDYLWLANDISKLSTKCSDRLCEKVTLNCGSELFHVPKFTLAARSKYFHNFFLSNFSDSKAMCFSIPADDASPYILRNALDYILTGDCGLLSDDKVKNWKEIIDLFKFSDKYEIESLYNACVPVIIANINTESVWTIMITAKQCNSDKILRSVENFFRTSGDFSLIANALISHILEYKNSKG